MALQNVTKIERTFTFRKSKLYKMGISCVSEIMCALLASKYKLQWKNMHVLFSG